MNVLQLVRQLLAGDDLYAEVLIGEGTGFADTVTRTGNGFVLLEPLPRVMAETLAAHQPADALAEYQAASNELHYAEQDADEPLPPLPQREPGRTLYPELAPEALAEHAPLQTLAAEPEDTP